MKTTKVHFNPAQYITGKAAVDIEDGSVVMMAKVLEDRNPVMKPAVAGEFPIGVVAQDVKKPRRSLWPPMLRAR
ncbi:hypothetical protein ACFPVT_02640 [Corynebacterium choanae]|uniref:Uncharacterized protein n=1 Tax=Corynebacterium choanae TaxID=1862358 RepID=A0A3G6J4H2_9CORY|nr:hypothetical protein [Corynebacterium choanae]AZA12975.1 hypothetical protein CCHOA_02795 [Corynebacterium choanae]